MIKRHCLRDGNTQKQELIVSLNPSPSPRQLYNSHSTIDSYIVTIKMTILIFLMYLKTIIVIIIATILYQGQPETVRSTVNAVRSGDTHNLLSPHA